jgi:anti-sigma regulatory factor (Ser/Thr protein kinase)
VLAPGSREANTRPTLAAVALPAAPEAVPEARRTVLGALDGWPVDRVAIGLAVTEAVSNAVRHAYRDGPAGEVRVRVTMLARAVEVAVEDDGLGLRPRHDSPGAHLGLPMIGSLADDLEVHAGPGTRLVMRFALDAATATEDAAPAGRTPS